VATAGPRAVHTDLEQIQDVCDTELSIEICLRRFFLESSCGHPLHEREAILKRREEIEQSLRVQVDGDNQVTRLWSLFRQRVLLPCGIDYRRSHPSVAKGKAGSAERRDERPVSLAALRPRRQVE